MLKVLTEAIYRMEDFISFKNIQLEKYNQSRTNPVKEEGPEWDVVYDLIKEYWCDLLSTGYLNSVECEDKSRVFHNVEIIFPYLEIPEQWMDGIIYIDFTSYK